MTFVLYRFDIHALLSLLWSTFRVLINIKKTFSTLLQYLFNAKWNKDQFHHLSSFLQNFIMKHNFTGCMPLQKTFSALPSAKLSQLAKNKIWINKWLNAYCIDLTESMQVGKPLFLQAFCDSIEIKLLKKSAMHSALLFLKKHLRSLWKLHDPILSRSVKTTTANTFLPKFATP